MLGIPLSVVTSCKLAFRLWIQKAWNRHSCLRFLLTGFSFVFGWEADIFSASAIQFIHFRVGEEGNHKQFRFSFSKGSQEIKWGGGIGPGSEV